VFPDDPDATWRRYPTAGWSRSVRPAELAECLYVLELLDAALPSGASGPALDVGSKSWSYLAAQRSVVPGQWDGVELDAHRRIGGLQTRASIARWRLAQHPGCRFIAGSVTDLPGPYGVVTWFLPFVHPEPHRRWGLPDSLFDPAALLRHVWSTVAPGGVLVVSNQGEAEADTQAALFAESGIAVEALGVLAASVSPFRHPRPVWRAVKPPLS
jgi:hypothetical protein